VLHIQIYHRLHWNRHACNVGHNIWGHHLAKYGWDGPQYWNDSYPKPGNNLSSQLQPDFSELCPIGNCQHQPFATMWSGPKVMTNILKDGIYIYLKDL
jgi:hypothetical protein